VTSAQIAHNSTSDTGYVPEYSINQDGNIVIPVVDLIEESTDEDSDFEG